MKTIKHLYMLLAVMFMAALPATAQNTTDDKNKAIIETNDGSKVLNTDEISVIRFDGGKVTVVHSEGETTFDRTLRSLSFQRPNPGTLRLTATTSIDTKGAGNRAQAIDGEGNLKSTWESGDVVYVYADENTTTSIGTLTPKTFGERTATLTGNITSTGLTNGQTLYFSTKDRSTLNLSSQNGTVESLFYFTATAPVNINGGNASVSDLDFTRPIAVVKFTLKNKATGNPAISAKSFTVHDGTNTCTVTPTAATNVLYVGIPDINTKTLTLTATDGNDYYLYQRAGVTFANNKYYAVNVKMQASDLARPLTLEAKTKGFIVIKNPQSGMQYSLNGGVKTQVPASIDVDKDDKVQFYGHGTSITSYKGTQIAGGTAECYVYGNIMSLVDEGSYATNTTLTDDHTFDGLFDDNTNIYNHADKALLLPATTLAKCCYEAMFYGCTNLTTAPELPATTLTDWCYAYMFQGCENLNSVTCLAADISAEYCTYSWLSNVATTGTFVKLESMADWESVGGIPLSWTVKSYEKLLPLTFEAKTAGATVTFTEGANVVGISPLEYSTDGKTWSTYTSDTPITLTNAGDKVSFRGNNETYAAGSSDNCNFSCTAGCYVYGNIMSLINKENFATNTTLTDDFTFTGLFAKNDYLYNHADKTLLLPATTLTVNCYQDMFQGCTSLTTAPALPETTLTENCYNDMFHGCTSLTKAPVLPATTLATGCYYIMFQGCTKLNSVTCLATEIGADGCTTNWLDGVAAAGMFYKAPDANWTTGASGIPSGWTTENHMLVIPLTFEAKTADATVTFTINTIAPNGVEYSTDGTTWTAYTSGTEITLANAGDKVSFRGTNTTYAAGSYDGGYSHFSCTKGCYVYGNIMSLVNKDNFATNTTLTGYYAFVGLFAGNTNIDIHADKALLLPATTLIYGCYENMFQGCTSLTTAPALPATTLTNHCYDNMFQGCTNLTTAPALPAETLAEYCYYEMFRGCTKLNNVTCLATYIWPDYCTVDWLDGVAATGTFYKPESMNDWTTDASGIPSGWTAKDAMLVTPLTFEAKTAGAQVTFTKSTDIDNLPVEYSLNGGAWKTYDAPISLAKVGDKVSFRGNNKTYAAGSSKYSTFSCSDDCYIYGNIMSLIDKDNFATNTTLTDGFTFNGLFMNNTHIYNHADNALLLPATTLINDCYAYMFYGCTGLTKAPVLPATTLSANCGECYACMFGGCTGLTTAPALPAETLSPSCYTSMFYGCTSLATAPALPAETLSSFCYYGMFHGCTSLTTAPTLPAATLVNSCYQEMFYGCTSLNSVTCLATDITANNCTDSWLDGVAETGTFYKHPNPIWPSHDNGIPDGWTVIDIGSISYATTEVNKTTADAAFTNELTHYGNGPVTYAVTSGDNICTVNASTGEVTLNGTVGSCTITATVTDIPSCIYATKTASYTLTVTPATLSVTASDYSGTYDGTAHGITVTCDGATIKYRTTDSGEYDLTENPTYSTVGTYTVYYQVTRDKYPTVTGSNTVSISKATLTATAADASRDYGSSNPTFTVNVTGFMNGETASTAAGYIAPTASTVATPSSNVGDYAITPSGGSATNYDFTYVNGTLTINKANPTYTPPTAKKGLTFTGSTQTLINAGSATGGTMYYSLNNSDWYTSVDNIKKTNANTSGYPVYYKVVGDGNHNDVASASINVPIAKANGFCTLSSTSSSGWRAGYKEKKETIKVTHHGGKLTATSSNSAITVSISGDEVTISRKAMDFVTTPINITISSDETANYNAASATFTCNE